MYVITGYRCIRNKIVRYFVCWDASDQEFKISSIDMTTFDDEDEAFNVLASTKIHLQLMHCKIAKLILAPIPSEDMEIMLTTIEL